MHDVVGQQILNGFLEDVLLGIAADLEPVGNAHGELDEGVIEKRYAAFDGGGHAHLVLLHQQLDEISLLVGIEHAAEEGRIGVSVPVAQKVRIDARRGGAQQAFLFGLGKSTAEVIEIERFDGGVAADDGVAELAPEVAAEQRGGGDLGTNEAAQWGGHQLVGFRGAHIQLGPAIAFIAAEEFVAAFAGEHDFHLGGGQLGHEMQRNAGRPGDGFVFVPDERGQGIEEIFHADDDLVMVGADGAGHLSGVTQFAVLGFVVADGESLHRAIGHAADEGGDGAGIDAATEEHAEGHIGH